MRRLWLAALLGLLGGVACTRGPALKQRTEVVVADLSTPALSTHDVEFYSASLNRRMTYRVLLPASYETHPEQSYPLLLLLHGRNYSTPHQREWQANSKLTQLLEGAEIIAVLPEGDSSYYTNAAQKPEDRYEDYIVSDIMADVGSFYRVRAERTSHGIAGISMGGWGALNLGMRHPDMFTFVASLSGPLDITSRPSSWRRPFNARSLRKIFGQEGSRKRAAYDIYNLERARAGDLHDSYFFLSCGSGESLLDPNRRMANAMRDSALNYKYIEVAGDHNWDNWNQVLPQMITAAREKLGAPLANPAIHGAARTTPPEIPLMPIPTKPDPMIPNPRPHHHDIDRAHPPS